MNIKDMFLIYAKHNHETDKSMVSILSTLSNEEREKDRGSYFGSLSGMARHVLEGTIYFQGLFKTALAHNAGVLKALASVEKHPVPKDKLTEDQWKTLAAAFEVVDTAFINLVAALTEEDFKVPVKVSWYGGNPDAVPLYFLLQSFVVHGAHHRGQVSQILDEQKIDNNYSGINLAFLSH